MPKNARTQKAIDEKIALFSAWVESQMAYTGQPGLSVGLAYEDELVWSKGFGYADTGKKTPATPQTLYRIASISKLFTATAVMQLRDAGKLQLDDPVAKHLPWFKKVAHKGSRPITVQHLITHTSGLSREAPFPYWSDLKFPTREQMVESLGAAQAILPVDEAWKYSNLAVSVAGEVVAAVSGESYPAYIQAHILNPLGMTQTCVETPDPQDPRLATGYARRLPDGSRALAPFTDCKGITPAANLTTCVEDLARFASFHLGSAHPEVLAPETRREMQRIHWLQPDWQAGWGLGFRIERQGSKTLVGHGGSVNGYRTMVGFSPEDRIAGVVLGNADDTNPPFYFEKLFKWVGGAVHEAYAPKPKAFKLPENPERYLGRFRDAWGDSQVVVLNGELALIGPDEPDPTLAVLRLEPVGEHTFRMHAANGYASHGELAVFEMDAQGKVCKLTLGNTYTLPVERW